MIKEALFLLPPVYGYSVKSLEIEANAYYATMMTDMQIRKKNFEFYCDAYIWDPHLNVDFLIPAFNLLYEREPRLLYKELQI